MLMVFFKLSGSISRQPLPTGVERGRLLAKKWHQLCFLGARACAGGSGWMAKCLSHPSPGPVLCRGMLVRKFT